MDGSVDRSGRIPRARARRLGHWLRACAAVVAIGAIQCTNVTSSPADSPHGDGQSAGADLAHASDFRVRVSAALVLGKTRPEGARLMLEHALADTHPAVRTAAAAALAALGEAAAIAALDHAMRSEPSGSARAQMQTSIEALRGGARAIPKSGARYVVQLGSMKSAPNVGGDLSGVLRAAARSQAASLPGAMVVDAAEAPPARAGMPVLLFDGQVTRLVHTSASGTTRIEAQVEFAVRRIPQQTLTATLSGTATTIESTRSLSPSRVAELQNQAIGGAVESALRGADRVALAAK